MMLQALTYLRRKACQGAAGHGTHPGLPRRVRACTGKPGNRCVFVHAHRVHGLGVRVFRCQEVEVYRTARLCLVLRPTGLTVES